MGYHNIGVCSPQWCALETTSHIIYNRGVLHSPGVGVHIGDHITHYNRGVLHSTGVWWHHILLESTPSQPIYIANNHSYQVLEKHLTKPFVSQQTTSRFPCHYGHYSIEGLRSHAEDQQLFPGENLALQPVH